MALGNKLELLVFPNLTVKFLVGAVETLFPITPFSILLSFS
jgi:hypothetical protein